MISIFVLLCFFEAAAQKTANKPKATSRAVPVKHTTYHVNAASGDDNSKGSSSTAAFKSIQKTADLAQPGNTILVYAGVYRERVKPARGGTSENNRITYLAKSGDHVVLTGLDTWKPSWQKEGNLYVATPTNELFTESNYVDGGNPFKIGYMSLIA